MINKSGEKRNEIQTNEEKTGSRFRKSAEPTGSKASLWKARVEKLRGKSPHIFGGKNNLNDIFEEFWSSSTGKYLRWLPRLPTNTLGTWRVKTVRG